MVELSHNLLLSVVMSTRNQKAENTRLGYIAASLDGQHGRIVVYGNHYRTYRNILSFLRLVQSLHSQNPT